MTVLKHRTPWMSAVALVIGLAVSAAAQQPAPAPTGSKDKTQPAPAATQSAPAAKMSVPSGQKVEVEGVIIRRDADSLTIRDDKGQEAKVVLNNQTEVKERKSNPFRSGRNYATTQL